MSKLNFLPIIIPFAMLFYSCSASTDTRYSKDSEKEISKTRENEKIAEDDFDIKPFRTKIDIPAESKETKDATLDLWFGYPSDIPEDQTKKTVVDTIQGYRVQVISTDNLDEANSVRSEIYFKTNEKAIYVIFEPPFYVVRVGDYKNINDAKALSFKLNQLGFAGTKVVNDMINIYK
jgi:inner membrane protein involved in colicin E2 resistance